MRALVVTEPGGAQLREWPNPNEVAGEVGIEPLVVGLCGTDLELVDGTIDATYVRYPLILGHEWVGRLERDTPGVGPRGARVVVEGIVPCGVCAACLRGATNVCAVYDEIGFTRPGAAAQRISVPERLVHALDERVDSNDAVFVEPMAVVWRALTRVALRPGLRVAIVGDGTIALLAAHLVRLFKPHSTTVFARRSQQRDLALRAGADVFEVTAPFGEFDLIIEASGSLEGVSSAIDHCARSGMIIALGLPPHGTTVDFAPDDLVNNDVILQGSFAYTREAFTEVVRRVNSLELRPSFLITHRYPMVEAPSALSSLRVVSNTEPRGKVIITNISPDAPLY